MSDDLRRVYEVAGLAARFFEDATPIDLYRAQTFREEKHKLPIIYPNPGFPRLNKATGKTELRPADVSTFKRNGEEWVQGCRTIRGNYRGVSMFDRVNPAFKGGKWYMLSKGADIPPSLAVLQDGQLSNDRETHFTIAPKDDMPKSLYQVWLNALGDKLVKAV